MTRAAIKSLPLRALLVGARRAFCSLVPIADDLGVRWREPENYLEWDAVARGVFEGFVLSAIRSSRGWTDCAPLLEYDKRVSHYSQFSYVGVALRQDFYPLICFETSVDPFDTCLLADLGRPLNHTGYLRLPFNECCFSAVCRLSSNQLIPFDTIEWQD